LDKVGGDDIVPLSCFFFLSSLCYVSPFDNEFDWFPLFVLTLVGYKIVEQLEITL
jgi:hypothetical protein